VAESEEGAMLEAIALFQAVREGKQTLATQLLETAAQPETVTRCLLRMLGVYLRGEDPEKLDRFIAAAHRAGVPPELNSRHSLP